MYRFLLELHLPEDHLVALALSDYLLLVVEEMQLFTGVFCRALGVEHPTVLFLHCKYIL